MIKKKIARGLTDYKATESATDQGWQLQLRARVNWEPLIFCIFLWLRKSFCVTLE